MSDEVTTPRWVADKDFYSFATATVEFDAQRNSQGWIDGVPEEYRDYCLEAYNAGKMHAGWAGAGLVLPEYRGDDYPDEQTKGAWNACINEVKRLNSK